MFYVSIKVQDRLKNDKMVRGFNVEEPTDTVLAALRIQVKRSFYEVTRKQAASVEMSVTPNPDTDTEEGSLV